VNPHERSVKDVATGFSPSQELESG